MVMTSKGEEGFDFGDWHIIVHHWRSGKGLNFFLFFLPVLRLFAAGKFFIFKRMFG